MIEKWQRQPGRVGMVAGFVALPILWWLQECVLRLATSYFLPSSREILNYFAQGALPGAVLGAGISQAYFAFHKGERRQAKRDLLFSSALVLGAILISFLGRSGRLRMYGFFIPGWLSFWLNPDLYKNFAFQVAVLVFFIGLLMRSRS